MKEPFHFLKRRSPLGNYLSFKKEVRSIWDDLSPEEAETIEDEFDYIETQGLEEIFGVLYPIIALSKERKIEFTVGQFYCDFYFLYKLGYCVYVPKGVVPKLMKSKPTASIVFDFPGFSFDFKEETEKELSWITSLFHATDENGSPRSMLYVFMPVELSPSEYPPIARPAHANLSDDKFNPLFRLQILARKDALGREFEKYEIMVEADFQKGERISIRSLMERYSLNASFAGGLFDHLKKKRKIGYGYYG